MSSPRALGDVEVGAGRYWRPLRPEEGAVQFDAIRHRLDESAERFYARIAAILQAMRDEITEDAVAISRQGRLPEWTAIAAVSLAYTRRYRSFLKDYLNDLYQWSKAEAATELGVPTPVTSQTFQQWMESKAQLVAAQQESMLLGRVRSSLLSNPPPGQIPVAVRGIFDEFAETELRRGAEAMANLGLQAGREDVAAGIWEEIAAVTWSAVLDDRVCETCQILDGVTWRPGDRAIIFPPLHWWCRCLLVLTPKGGGYIPAVTGLPDGFEMPWRYRQFMDRIGRYTRLI